MAKINLKSLLSKNNEAANLVSSLLEGLQARVRVEDLHQQILLGDSVSDLDQAPILSDGEIIGWVKGEDKAKLVAGMINLLAEKEAERKKLGNEILMLYREVNLIFNFSEKLAQTIGQNAIASLTLQEAMHLIKSDNGLIILWDENTSQLEVLASAGTCFSGEEKFKANIELLRHISQNGQSEIIGDLSALKEAGLIMPDAQSLIYAALKVKHRVMGAIVLASTEPVQYSAADLKFLITLALQTSGAIESALLYEKNIREAREKEEAMRRMYEITNKFVPHEFIQSLGKKGITEVQLGDQVEKVVTVLFSDIRNYTTLSEKMTPEETFAFVSSFNAKMGPIIRQCNGFINQYLGDAIMAIFPHSAADALGAAIKMQKAVREFNVSRVLKMKAPIKIGIGMHTGPLIMGITGDHQRLDATTIADAVNTAARLENLTKHYASEILLSEACLKSISGYENLHIRHLGRVQLKGKMEPITVYECFNGSDENNIQKKLSSLPVFNEAMTDYFSKSFKDATDKFSKVLEIHPDDMTTRLFLRNAHNYINNGVPENWTGIEEMRSMN